MSVWKDLGLVDTINEEEEEEDDDRFTHSSDSASLSSSPVSLHSRVQAWSHHTGQKTDIVVHVQDSSFKLHKDPLIWMSGYLKRQLTDANAVTLSPPLNITAETFTLVAEFCYGAKLVVTPFNVAAIRVAADLLKMTEEYGDGNLVQITEEYFRRVIDVNPEYASIVFRSCLELLPEAETTSFLISRCIESLTREGDGGANCMADFETVSVDYFQLIVESMHYRITRSHDILYKIVDHYIKVNLDKITEEQIHLLCNTIDCTKLSTQTLTQAIQNPKMPLRFIVRAMFIQQLNTRGTIISAATHRRPKTESAITLAAVLQRDTAIQQSEQIQAAMDATKSRIQSLEKELNEMKKLLSHQSGPGLCLRPSAKSESFRFSSGNKVQRGERNSVSSTSLRFNNTNSISPRVHKANNIGKRLMNGLKNVFRVSKHENGRKQSDSRNVNGENDIYLIEEDEDMFSAHTQRIPRASAN